MSSPQNGTPQWELMPRDPMARTTSRSSTPFSLHDPDPLALPASHPPTPPIHVPSSVTAPPSPSRSPDLAGPLSNSPPATPTATPPAAPSPTHRSEVVTSLFTQLQQGPPGKPPLIEWTLSNGFTPTLELLLSVIVQPPEPIPSGGLSAAHPTTPSPNLTDDMPQAKAAQVLVWLCCEPALSPLADVQEAARGLLRVVRSVNAGHATKDAAYLALAMLCSGGLPSQWLPRSSYKEEAVRQQVVLASGGPVPLTSGLVACATAPYSPRTRCQALAALEPLAAWTAPLPNTATPQKRAKPLTHHDPSLIPAITALLRPPAVHDGAPLPTPTAVVAAAVTTLWNLANPSARQATTYPVFTARPLAAPRAAGRVAASVAVPCPLAACLCTDLVEDSITEMVGAGVIPLLVRVLLDGELGEVAGAAAVQCLAGIARSSRHWEYQKMVAGALVSKPFEPVVARYGGTARAEVLELLELLGRVERVWGWKTMWACRWGGLQRAVHSGRVWGVVGGTVVGVLVGRKVVRRKRQQAKE